MAQAPSLRRGVVKGCRVFWSGYVALAESDPRAVVMHALMEIEHQEVFLEIRELDPLRRLVTCIEVLSPFNQRAGSAG
ncbi:MAG: DUF4058 family protein [Candidatus Anammoximicrobium sp.]|nr:DUF4058 family protein [Candidatus Anammoximicrobium sp.]